MPNMTILAPKNLWELSDMIKFAVDYDGPIAVRYPRGEAYTGLKEFRAPICLGKSEVIHEGSRVALLAVGKMCIRDRVGSVRTSVPPHLQDAHYKGSAKLGHGEGYQYAHDYPNHYVEQQYLPDEILGSRFLHLGTNGYEQKIRENFKKIGKDIE